MVVGGGRCVVVVIVSWCPEAGGADGNGMVVRVRVTAVAIDSNVVRRLVHACIR